MIALGPASINGGTLSSQTYAARGSFQLMAYWDRVLTDDEIAEAFSTDDARETAAHAPAIVKYGGSDYFAEMCAGATTGAVTDVSADVQDISSFPAGLETGRTLRLPFKVLDTCTNLPQAVRLSFAVDSSAGELAVSVDEGEEKNFVARSGGTVSYVFPAEVFTEGGHMLKIRRTDAGTDPVKFAGVEISGSWRLGWKDGKEAEFLSEGGSASPITYSVDNLVSNEWKLIRSTIKASKATALKFQVAAEDITRRRFSFSTRSYTYVGQDFELIVKLNDAEIHREYRQNTSEITVQLPSKLLQAGENVITVVTDKANYPASSSTWLRLDYFQLDFAEVRGTALYLR